METALSEQEIYHMDLENMWRCISLPWTDPNVECKAERQALPPPVGGAVGARMHSTGAREREAET